MTIENTTSRFMSFFPSFSFHFYRPWCFQITKELDELHAKNWILWMKIAREMIFQSWLLQNANFHYFPVVNCWSRRKYFVRNVRQDMINDCTCSCSALWILLWVAPRAVLNWCQRKWKWKCIPRDLAYTKSSFFEYYWKCLGLMI